MSETDDTDELLLIPPEFFLSHPTLDGYSTNLGPYYGVVDSLITQVTQLEDRLNVIENSSEISLSVLSNSSEMNSPQRYRRCGSSDDLPSRNYSSSTHSTPQKPRTRYSLPNSPDVDKSRRGPKHRLGNRKAEVSPMLGEIDHFISNVKMIKRMNAVRNLEGDFNSTDNCKSPPKGLELNQVDDMLKELELGHAKINKHQEKTVVKEKTWRTGEDINSVPDYGLGMRQEMYKDTQQEPLQASTDTSVEKHETDSSSESTQITAFDRYQYKKVTEKGAGSEKNYGLGLVSLSKLWNSGELQENPTRFQQQLQEERLRRQICRQPSRPTTPDSCTTIQHCEQAIQDLQNRMLELQERVAVAIQVDEAKDKAILRFHDSWEKTGSKLQEVEKEREKLEQEVDSLMKKLDQGSEEILQKISHYEKEASKALNLAHSSQEKLATMEKQYSQMERELRAAEEFQMKYMAEIERSRQYPEILAQKELELNECKTVLAEARKEVSQSKKAVEICQSELLSMREERESLQSKLDVEKDHARKLHEQKTKLLEEINAHKSISKGLQEELTKTREQLESNKVELKNFYQGQVELVVQSKLKEFQKQLDEAEKALKEELTRKEMSIAKTAASHIQQISEKHLLEVKLLEEKHQEECRLYQLQLAQLRREKEEAHHKIKRQQEKHVHIERQLHKFMESLRQDHVTTLDEMNSFRSKSFNSLEEILAFNMAEEERRKEQEEQMGDTTPLTSRNEKGARRKESTLQETIQMLLDKRAQGEKSYEDLHQQATKEVGMAFYQRLAKDTKGKPPWK